MKRSMEVFGFHLPEPNYKGLLITNFVFIFGVRKLNQFPSKQRAKNIRKLNIK